MKRSKSFYIRALISLLLIVLVFSRVSLGELLQTIRTARWEWLLISFAITPVLILVSAWKWQIILRAYSIKVKLSRLFWLYTVGYFFNTVLPTNVGGDVVRAMALGKSIQNRAQAFSSVFIERFTGLTALLFMAIVAFLLAVQQFWGSGLIYALIICLAGYLFIVYMLFSPVILKKISNLFSMPALLKIFNKLESFQSAILEIRHQKKILIFAMFNGILRYTQLPMIGDHLQSLIFPFARFSDFNVIQPKFCQMIMQGIKSTLLRKSAHHGLYKYRS